MQLAQVAQSRKLRTFSIMIPLAILVILIVAIFSQSRRSPKPFEMDDLYGLLD